MHIEKYLEKMGLRWVETVEKKTLGECIDWEVVEIQTRNYEKRKLKKRGEAHKNFVFFEFEGRGYLTFGDKIRSKKVFGLGRELDCFSEKMFEFFSFGSILGNDEIKFYSETKNLFEYVRMKETVENKEKIFPGYELKHMFHPEEAENEVRRALSMMKFELVEAMKKREKEMKEILLDGLYEAIIKDFPEERKKIEREEEERF